MMMQKLSHQFRHFMQLTAVLLTIVVDAVCFLRLCLRLRPTLAAENRWGDNISWILQS